MAGPELGLIQPCILPDDAFALDDTQVLQDPTALHVALNGLATGWHRTPRNATGDPGMHQAHMHNGCVLPDTFLATYVTLSSPCLTFMEFYDTFITPRIGNAAWLVRNHPLADWWSAAVTSTLDDGHGDDADMNCIDLEMPTLAIQLVCHRWMMAKASHDMRAITDVPAVLAGGRPEQCER